MGPKDYLPAWEQDFWSTLMEDQGVEPGFSYWADPTEMFESEPYGSPYAVGDVLVGEIVEDEQTALRAL